ncbi:MAG: hypothetical protein KAG34_03255 [Cocleimonas sp.]|nr:hypothetical protein [Cocleimonas sp.]
MFAAFLFPLKQNTHTLLQNKGGQAFELSASTIRKVTLSHAEIVNEQQHKNQELPKNTAGCAVEIDGCMVPIMKANEEVKDKRKKKNRSLN